TDEAHQHDLREAGGAAVAGGPDLAFIAVGAAGGIAAGRGEGHRRTVVREPRLSAVAAGAASRDHALAAGGRVVRRIVALVAGGNHLRDPALDRAVDGFLRGRIVLTTAGAAEAEVEHLGRALVVRHPIDVAARGPGDAVCAVGRDATAMAKHAHRLHFRTVGQAGNVLRVVGHGRHRARHVRAMPGAGGNPRAPVAHAAVGPVARIVGVVVATVAVTGHVRIQALVGGLAVVADEVVAGDDVADQVRMVRVTGVEHGDHDTLAAGDVPRGRRAHATSGVGEIPLQHGELRVVGSDVERMAHVVGLRVLDVGITAQAGEEGIGLGLRHRAGRA